MESVWTKMLKEDTKPFLLGTLIGAACISWLGFAVIGWQSSSTAERMAKKRANEDVISAEANVCKFQFSSAANQKERLASLLKVDRYARGELLAKDGFATMPGSKEPVSGVAEACANLLAPEAI